MANERDGIVLVGHGSRSATSQREMRTLRDLVAAALAGVEVEVGYLELTDPPAGPVVDQLVRRGCGRVVVVPLVMLGAGHAKSDVPAVVVEARTRHPRLDVRFARPLGVCREPVELLGKAVAAAGGAGAPLLVVARGSTDPDANSDAHKAARLVGEWTGASFVHVGFSGLTRPTVSEAAELFARLGFPRVAVAWWFLCQGVLVDRGRAELAEVASRYRLEIVDAGHVGPDPALVTVIVSRYREALDGAVAVNCDTCAYRAPWPGLEARVGQAIGVGHSHLAVEHRHRH